MAFEDYSTTPGDNTTINGIGIQGSNNVQNFDNAFRQLMADAKTFSEAAIPDAKLPARIGPVPATFAGDVFALDEFGIYYVNDSVATNGTGEGNFTLLVLPWSTANGNYVWRLGFDANTSSKYIQQTNAGTDGPWEQWLGSKAELDALYAVLANGTTVLAEAGVEGVQRTWTAANLKEAVIAHAPAATPPASGSTALAEAGTDTTQRTWTAANLKEAVVAHGVTVSTATSNGTTSFPVGHTVLVNNSEVNRNASSTVYAQGGSSTLYNTAGGSALSGTWRARGVFEAASDNGTLFQRVS